MTSIILLKSMLFTNALKKKPKIKTKKAKIKKMSDSKITKLPSNMCRICDQEKGEIAIFNNSVQPNIPEDILHFSGVPMDISDSLSKHMCQSCLDLLNGCIMFKEICQRTNKKLIEKAIKKESNSESDIVACEQVADIQRFGDSDGDDFQEELSEICCSCCGKGYLDLAALDSHLKICKPKTCFENRTQPSEETLKKRFLCDVCGKTSSSNANLLAHIILVENWWDTAHQWDTWKEKGETFAQQWKRASHILGLACLPPSTTSSLNTRTTHEPIFPFKCDECPYMGRTMDLLKVHKRSHLTEKPFKCPQCDKGTTTASNLTKHIRHVHNTSRPYKCNYCVKAFSSQHDMKRHIRDIHLRQGTVECDLCFKSFNTRKILRGHQWKVHKIKGERQGRLPSYLQWQMEERSENHDHIDGETEQMVLT